MNWNGEASGGETNEGRRVGAKRGARGGVRTRGVLQAAVGSVAADGQQLVHAESAHR